MPALLAVAPAVELLAGVPAAPPVGAVAPALGPAAAFHGAVALAWAFSASRPGLFMLRELELDELERCAARSKKRGAAKSNAFSFWITSSLPPFSSTGSSFQHASR